MPMGTTQTVILRMFRLEKKNIDVDDAPDRQFLAPGGGLCGSVFCGLHDEPAIFRFSTNF